MIRKAIPTTKPGPFTKSIVFALAEQIRFNEEIRLGTHRWTISNVERMRNGHAIRITWLRRAVGSVNLTTGQENLPAGTPSQVATWLSGHGGSTPASLRRLVVEVSAPWIARRYIGAAREWLKDLREKDGQHITKNTHDQNRVGPENEFPITSQVTDDVKNPPTPRILTLAEIEGIQYVDRSMALGNKTTLSLHVFDSLCATASLGARAKELSEAQTNEVIAAHQARDEAKAHEREALEKLTEPPAPLPMILFCPTCHARHIDEGEFATRVHHTHACQNCGLVWRPARLATVGVRFLPGFKNGGKAQLDVATFSRQGMPLKWPG